MQPRAGLDRRTFEEIEVFLRERRARLTESVRSAVTLRSAQDSGRPSEYAAWATETLDNELQATFIDRQSRSLDRIEAALDRLQRREYGFCRDCGEFIGLARLRALPFAERCTSCQSRAEVEEKEIGRRPEKVVVSGVDDD